MKTIRTHILRTVLAGATCLGLGSMALAGTVTTTTELTTTSTTSTTSTTEPVTTSTTTSLPPVTTSTSTTTTSTQVPDTTTSTTSTTSTTTTSLVPAGFCGDGATEPCRVIVDSAAGAFDNLQEAINDAPDGATLSIEGVCRGPITINGRRGLTLQGPVPTESGCPEDGPGPTGLRATVRGNGSDRDAIRVKRSEDIVIRYLNIIKGKDDGVDFKRSNTSTLHCSCVTRNKDDGVELDGGDGHQVTQNLIVRNKDDGIIVERSRDNVLHANTIQENKDDGLELDRDSDRNLVVSNLIENNGEDGIDVDNSDANRILANEVNSNGDRRRDNGIELRKSDDNVVDGNTIRDNGDNLVDVVRCQSGADDNRGSNVVPPCGTTTPEPSETFQFGLNGAEEVPPVVTSADGFCTGILDGAQTTFELVCTHSVSDTAAAHIHRGVVGMDGPIVFDLGDPSSPITATWNLTATDVTALLADELYVNVHSPTFPDGEVRGQID